MSNKRLLIINTGILTVSGFLMRTVGVLFNVYLTNIIGSSGIGLYQLIVSVYSLVVTFACAGIKLGATRLVTDSLCAKQAPIKKIMRCCFVYSVLCGLAAAALLYGFANIISVKWIADENSALSLKILSLSLPFVAVSAALNGYFTARKTVLKYASVQIAEQTVRIITTVLSLSAAYGKGLSALCAAISAGTTLSELTSCFLCLILYRYDKKQQTVSEINSSPILKNLLRISVPDMLGSGVRSILLTIEHLLIPIGFRKSGQSTQQALSIYGTVHGMALPVVLYPAALLTSLANMLVPELSESLALGNRIHINRAANKCFRYAMIFSLGTAVFMFMFADNISCAVYSGNDSSFYIKLLSVLLPIMYLDTITDGLLKGLDRQLSSMVYNIIDSGLCVILVYFLLPLYSVKGYIFILFLSEIINFSLSINKLTKTAQLKINPLDSLFKPLLAAVGSGSIINLIRYGLSLSAESKPALIFLVVCYILLFLFSVSRLKCIESCDSKTVLSGLKRKRLHLTNRKILGYDRRTSTKGSLL